MGAKVLVISNDASGAAEWVAELKAARLQVTVTGAWPGALPLLQPHTEQVVVCDAHGACPVSEVLTVAQIAGLPVVVLARNLDAAQWLSLYKQGAFEVVSLPVPAEEIVNAIASALRGAAKVGLANYL